MACVSPAGPSGLDKVPEAVLAEDKGAPIQDITKLSIGDEQPVEVTTTASGSYTMTAIRGKGYSPNSERYSPPFVRGGPRSHSDDPFMSAHARSRGPDTPKSAVIMGKKTWRSNPSSSDEESSSASVSSFRSKSTARKLTFGNQQAVVRTPDGNRNPPNGPDVDPEDAQSVYPPEWCVFVANLLQSETDSTLTAAVHQVFSQYGKVYVKIRRDAKQMPFAFCQYTKLEHAKHALQDARGRLICGRPCRCEMAKADRFYVIQRKYEAGITPEEARQVLEKFGKIKSCSPASPFERAAFFVNDGIVVSFQMYDMGQAAMQALRNNHEYKMYNLEGYGSPLKQGTHDRRSISTQHNAYLDRVEIDNRSIFVGNLPPSATETDLHGLFDTYGSILDISVRDSFSKFDSAERIYFAFVEFRSGITADSVVNAQNPFFLSGNKLRIAHKTTDNKKHGSPARGFSSNHRSPTPRRRIEQGTSPDSGSTYSPADQASTGYGSPAYASSGYTAPIYGPQVYGGQSYAPSYATPPYNSPQGYYQMGYAPQYGYGSYGNFNYYPVPYGAGQGPYATPYPPSSYPYQAAPGVDSQVPVAPDASGNPNVQPYWVPTTYSYAPQQLWTPPSTSSDVNSPAPPCPVAEFTVTEVTEGTEETEDRSATPTPSRPNPAAEQFVETQQ